ncbi:branched-chain amino acid ABC transporter permease [Oceanibaculum indicum]|uniref:Branched-chain amino acid ABC transporter, permease component (LivH-like) protein n=1 Tax=Oceanibaculum indicum P24 TaxID=1207063 RepID=K2JM32_9PROT|nr:branched-chain amino acid ABC transporter permease [Oceanibaculum indicum]EKE76383.1 Branched-chain amino acid ABC transporter, permease component (LivH-like) protein [Oceanibaculum indicum P24]
MTGPRHHLRTGLACLLLVLLMAPLGGCGTNIARSAACERFLSVLEPGYDRIDWLRWRHPEGTLNNVRGEYRLAGSGVTRWIRCDFAAEAQEDGSFALIRLETDRKGVLTPVQRHMLFLALRLAGPAPERPASPWQPAAYFFQQLLNALTVASPYALLAAGFTLIYGIIGRINFAFGEMAMLGAYVTVLLAVLAGEAGGVLTNPLVLLGLLAAVMAITGFYGWQSERLVFRPLRGSPSHAVLIAAIGLSILLQEGVRLVQGTRDRWLQPVFSARYRIADSGDFAVYASLGQLVLIATAASLLAGLLFLLARHRTGRAIRACGEDARMAALLGVDVDRTVALCFAIGSALAAAAGLLLALYYGGVNFHMGFLIGFKALAAAIIGGIGSVPGAILGAFVIGALETFWSAYFTGAYKDVSVFALLAVILIFRPHGLLGRRKERGD